MQSTLRERVLFVFGERSNGLTFTSESAEHDTLILFDLTLQFNEDHRPHMLVVLS